MIRLSIVLFVLWVGLWGMFVAALATRPAALDGTWRSVRSLPLPVELVVWFLFLPWMVGLAVWENAWSTRYVRLALLAGVAVLWTLPFLPR